MTTYFITGATGVLGSAIVQELLKNTSYKLVLLIRAKDDESLNNRKIWLLNFLKLNADIDIKRIEVIRGDIELERFGFSTGDYDRLGVTVTHIIHSAASVRMNLPLEQARRTAVFAAENILQFSEICQKNRQLKKVEIVSTVGVGGKWKGPLPERWIHEPRTFHNTYEQAKAEAEAIIEDKASNGLPLTVHRPSMIVGNSHTGSIPHFQIFYHLTEFIVGRRTWGVLPNISDHYVDLVPADYVAQVITWSSVSSCTAGRVLHLCAGPEQAILLEDLRKLATIKFQEQHLFTSKKIILSASFFKVCIMLVSPFVPTRLRKKLVTLPIFLDYLSDEQVFSNKETRQLLESSGFISSQSDNFLNAVINYYLNQIYHKNTTTHEG